MGVPTLTDSTNYAEGKPAVGPTIVRADINALYNEMAGNLDATNLADGAATTAKIGPAAVTEAKINSGAVTNDKLSANAVYEANVYWGSASSGVLAVRAGPNYAGNGAPRIARVRKSSIDFSTGSPKSVTFTFASDCVDGSPTFASAPVLMGQPIVTASDSPGAVDAITAARVTTLDKDQAIIELTYGASTATVTVEFGVLGAIS